MQSIVVPDEPNQLVFNKRSQRVCAPKVTSISEVAVRLGTKLQLLTIWFETIRLFADGSQSCPVRAKNIRGISVNPVAMRLREPSL